MIARIKELFNPPLKLQDIQCNVEGNSDRARAFHGQLSSFLKRINFDRHFELTPNEYNKRINEVLHNTEWIKLCSQLHSDENAFRNFPLVNWNSILLGLKDYQYSDKLILTFDIGHSYEHLLHNNPFINATITGIIETSDGYFIGGIRSGHHDRGSFSFLPAGCIDFDPNKKEHVFSTMRKETNEELGIDIENPELISINIINKRYSFAFHANTALTCDEVKKRWDKAKDKMEHSELIFIPKNNLRKEVLLRYPKFNAHSAMGAFSYLLIHCDDKEKLKNEIINITEGKFQC